MKTNLLILIAFIAVTMSSCSERIEAGYEGILVKQYGSDKGVQDASLVTGRVWYNPWTEDVEQYPTFVQTLDYEPFTVNAKDGSEFTVDPTLSYNIVVGNSPLEKEGFHLEQLTSGLVYPKTIVDAVNSKNKAIQEAMKAENELRVVEAQAKNC